MTISPEKSASVQKLALILETLTRPFPESVIVTSLVGPQAKSFLCDKTCDRNRFTVGYFVVDVSTVVFSLLVVFSGVEVISSHAAFFLAYVLPSEGASGTPVCDLIAPVSSFVYIIFVVGST